MNKCLVCAEPISEKSTFCGDAHRMKYRRRTKQGEQPEQNDPEHAPRTLNFSPTRTDTQFEEGRPNYYNFSDELFERECTYCKKQFKTHLKLLEQCSPKCKQALLKALSGDKAAVEGMK